ncbi:MAG: RsmE family RNA methyltransferase [Verrucomicrobiota bacterium]
MSLPRFYCADPDLGCFDGAEAHHASSVLRLRAGNQCVVFNGEGMELKAEILEITGKSVIYKPISRHLTPPLPSSLHLIQAVPKGKAMDLILQKTTELGVGSIHPVTSDRSVSRIGEDNADHKIDKWQSTILEACKQCGRNLVPEVTVPYSVDGLIDSLLPVKGLCLIASLQPDAKPLKTVLDENGRDHDDVYYVIGPEGDFTPAEIGKFRSAGFIPVSLGPNILRTETAAIFLTGILGYELFT